MGFRGAHLSDKTINKCKEVVIVKVTMVITSGGRKGFC